MELPHKAFIRRDKTAFFLDSQAKVQAIVSRMINLDGHSRRGFK